MSSSSGKPTPSLQQLNLRTEIRESLRRRNKKILDADGSNDGSEGALVAEKAQDEACIGTEAMPLYGGPQFKMRVLAIKGAFKSTPQVVEDDALAKVVEHMLTSPGEWFRGLSEPAPAWRMFVARIAVEGKT